MKAPTPAQRRALYNLCNGNDIDVHFRTQSEYGGAVATIRAMVARGWITQKHRLTKAGRQLCVELFGGM